MNGGKYLHMHNLHMWLLVTAFGDDGNHCVPLMFEQRLRACPGIFPLSVPAKMC